MFFLILYVAIAIVVTFLLGWGIRRLGGPLFVFEMVRSARKQSLVGLRIGFAAILLLVLFLFYVYYFKPDWSQGPKVLFYAATLSTDDISGFSERFFYTMQGVQGAVVLFLTPLLVAGALSEERRTGTIDLLLTSHLTSREIVFSKLFSRLATMVLLLFAGIGVLVIVQFMGGVDPNQLIASYSVLIINIIAISGLTIHYSVRHAEAWPAMWRTYVAVGIYCVMTFPVFCCSGMTVGFRGGTPYFASAHPVTVWVGIWRSSSDGALNDDLPWILLIYGSIYVAFATFFIWRASSWLRRPLKGAKPPRRDLPSPKPLRPVPKSLRTRSSVDHSRKRYPKARPAQELVREPERKFKPPAMMDNPISWRERYLMRDLGYLKDIPWRVSLPELILWVLSGAVLVIALLETVLEYQTGAEIVQGWIRIVLIVLTLVLGGKVALRTAGAITSERERQTMLSLLLTEITREEILKAKFLAALWSVRYNVFFLLAALILGTIATGIHPLAAFLSFFPLPIFVTYCAVVGLFFSVRCSSTFRARMQTVIFLVITLGGHRLVTFAIPMLFESTIGKETASVLGAVLNSGLTSPSTIYALSFSWKEQADVFNGEKGKEVLGAILGLLIYVALTCLLWLWTRRAFNREGRG